MKQNNFMNNNTKMSQRQPYLEIILGPMYSGKTSKILDLYKQYKYCNISVLVINHALDKRYHEEYLSTHDQKMIPCIQTQYLQELENNATLENAEVILINEGQFFDDLYVFVKQQLKNGKKIYVCGLDGDFERKKFGQMLDIIPLCDKVYKLHSLCADCRDGTPALFSLRVVEERDQLLIGSNNYKPVCRNCYDTGLSKEKPALLESFA